MKGKIASRFVGSFEILERVGPIACRLALLPQLSGVHDVFHMSNLKKYVVDPNHVLSHESAEVGDDLTYPKRLVQILDRAVRSLRRKQVSLVKVLWRSQRYEEATWEPEETMREQDSDLF
jgi:hypothetical protein